MDGRRNRENIYPVLNLHGYVWTGRKDDSIEIQIYDTDKKQNIKMEFLTIYCFVFLLKMTP